MSETEVVADEFVVERRRHVGEPWIEVDPLQRYVGYIEAARRALSMRDVHGRDNVRVCRRITIKTEVNYGS